MNAETTHSWGIRRAAFAPEALRRASLKPWRRRAVATAAAVIMGGGSSVLACPLCFGAAETPLIAGANLGVLMLLGVTLAVQGGFVGFFLYLRSRAKRMADAELASEWSELQGATRAS